MDILPHDPNTPQKKYWFYRIIGFIDNFIAIFFLFVLFLSFVGLGLNSSLLLYLFIFLAVLIYTNLTAVFARIVMVQKKNMRTKLKDWIKVNGYVTLIYAIFMLMAVVYLLTNPAGMEKIEQMYSGVEGITEEMMEQALPVMKWTIGFFGFCMLLFVIHVIMTLKYLKLFADHFKSGADPNGQ